MYGICVLSFWTQKKNKFYFSIHNTFQSCTNVFINDRRTIIAVRFRRRLIKNVSQFSCRNQSKKMLFSVSTKTHYYSASCKGSYSLTPAWVATTPLRLLGGTILWYFCTAQYRYWEQITLYLCKYLFLELFISLLQWNSCTVQHSTVVRRYLVT